MNKLKGVFSNERGSFSIKGIAITVAVIVVIGTVMTALTGGLAMTWVNEVWSMFMTNIKSLVK